MSADLYEPFRVDWELATPMVIPDFAIHLDALLSRARVERDAALDLPVPWANQYDLPLARFETASDWCFKASTLVLTPLGQPMQYHQVRRANVDTWRYGFERGLFARTPPFDPGRTYTKAVSMQVPMQMMTHAHAYGVGNIEAVQALLQLLPSLGKLKRRSAGTIRSVKVSRCAADACFWFRRVLPADADLSQCGGYVYVPMLSPVRAPYWQRENSVNALMPVASELVLCAG